VAVCEALAFAHGELGLVHADVKPDNLLIGPDGVVRLADLGHAVVAGQRARAATRSFASPEQRAGRPLTHQSDVYALGMALATLATGSSSAMARTVALDADEPTVDLTPNVPAWLEDVVAWATHPDPNQRPTAPPARGRPAAPGGRRRDAGRRRGPAAGRGGPHPPRGSARGAGGRPRRQPPGGDHRAGGRRQEPPPRRGRPAPVGPGPRRRPRRRQRHRGARWRGRRRAWGCGASRGRTCARRSRRSWSGDRLRSSPTGCRRRRTGGALLAEWHAAGVVGGGGDPRRAAAGRLGPRPAGAPRAA
jgi:hypothetical protein